MSMHPEARWFEVDLAHKTADGQFVDIDHELDVNDFRDLDVHVKLSAHGFAHYVPWNVMFNFRNFEAIPD